ncbi:hypothetical protein [Psychromonas sp. KJ10-2]|uniref:hypothetical protein n=1 Tax=Psychromonas sp. KJ10-2 TaxID=3391822 RepID=UPI0039B59E94
MRLTQLIADKENIDDKQRAVLLYERGLIYDRMGLSAHSRYDFTQSINLDPTLAESYNSLGVYLLLGKPTMKPLMPLILPLNYQILCNIAICTVPLVYH